MSESTSQEQMTFDFDHPQSIKDLQNVEVVRLEKIFSWQQSYNRYPYYLSKADPHRFYSFEEVYTVVFETRPPGKKRDRETWIRNTFSIEIDAGSGQPVIKGIGLFEEVGKGHYRLSQDAIELGNTFAKGRENNDGEWLKVFASILAHYDIRTRCILYYMGKLGYRLKFPNSLLKNGFFSKSTPTWLVPIKGEPLSLFEYNVELSPKYSFTPVLQNVAFETFGPFLRSRFEHKGLRLDPKFVYIGAASKGKTIYEPSSDALNTYLKQTLSLFKDLGIIVYKENHEAWGINFERVCSIFPPDLVADLFTSQQADPFLGHLKEVYEKLADAEGLANVKQLRDWVCDLIGVASGERVHYFNERVAYYMSPEHNQLSIAKEFHAQAAPEDCLFFDLNKEYVAFVF
jgi:hypothetical protein